MSLKALFCRFMEEDLFSQAATLTPLQLRLLLHPLQSLVSQYRQHASSFSGNFSLNRSAAASPVISQSSKNTLSTIAIHKASAQARYAELQALLQRWQNLAIKYLSNHAVCPVMQAGLAMFHLIAMNASIDLPGIERLARKEDGASMSNAVFNQTEALFHAGQVLRLVRAMSAAVRPPWWAAAIYRAALVLWVVASAKEKSGRSPQFNSHTQHPVLIALDNLPTDNAVLVQWRTQGDLSGVQPVLNKRDGPPVSIDNSFAVLLHCIEVLDEGVANRFSDGIRSRLERLARG
jgi:hypothetical protein